MILIENQKQPEKIMLIAETKTDIDTLHYFNDKKVIRGLYLLYTKAGDKHKTTDPAKFLQKNFPLAEGLAMVNLK